MAHLPWIPRARAPEMRGFFPPESPQNWVLLCPPPRHSMGEGQKRTLILSALQYRAVGTRNDQKEPGRVTWKPCLHAPRAAAVTTAWDVFGELSKAHHFFCIIEFSAYFFLSVHNLPFMLFMYFLDNSEVTFLEKKILKEPMALYP